MGVRTYPDRPRVYVDMDGVIADFEGALRAHGLTPGELKIKRGAYQALPIIEGAKEALHAFIRMGLEVFGLTKIPGSNPYAATEKLLWIAAHFPELHDRVIITPDKGCVGTPRDFLIDDHPEWANADKFAGTIVRFAGDWPAVVEQIRIGMRIRQAMATAGAPAVAAAPLPAPDPSPFKSGVWIASATQTGRVRYVHPDGTLDIVLFDRCGRQIGRLTPPMGGPRGFEPNCSPDGWRPIAKPDFPATKFAFIHDLVLPSEAPRSTPADNAAPIDQKAA